MNREIVVCHTAHVLLMYYKTSSRFNTTRYIDCQQQKTSLLHRLSTTSEYRTLTANREC